MPVTIYKGTLINPESPEDLIVKEHCLVAVEDGIIKGIYSEKDTLPEQYMNAEMVDFGDKLIIPAFSDLHIHASQYAQRGTGMDCLLFDWLNRYTFPQESRFQNTDYARIIYAQVIRDFLTHGTMHVNLFSTIHYDACDLFFRMLEESGMYAFTGKINMDQNSPDFYVEDTDRSLEDTERFICEHSGSGFSGRVKNILIPRFAPTCSERLLKGLGKLAEKYDLGLHTHLVESRAEAEWSKELYPQYLSDGDIYEQTGLLSGSGPKIFAHVIFPTDVEENVLRKYNAVSVHCPESTNNITAGIMPAKKMQQQGFRVALGTDVGGGHFMGTYRIVKSAIKSSKLKEFYEEDHHRLLFSQAFYMATAEGGSVFGKIGKLEPGYHFNALVLREPQDEGYTLPVLEQLERFCYMGDDRDIACRILDGKIIDPNEVYQRVLNL